MVNTWLEIRLRSDNSKKKISDKDLTINDSKPKNSPKEKMKKYSQKLKERPDLYQAYLEAEAARNRAYRNNLNETEKDRQRDITRIRVQKQREKQKVNQAANQIQPKNSEAKKNNVLKTRNKIKEMRDYWRLKKQQQRENMSAQKKEELMKEEERSMQKIRTLPNTKKQKKRTL